MLNDRANASGQRRDLILRNLDDAYYQGSGAKSGQALKKANEMLQEILEMMKNKTERMLQEDHNACWEKWVSVKETVKFRRQELCDFNYGKYRGEAYEAKGLAESFPRDAKAKVRETQQAMKGCTMERWQFDEINGLLNEAYKHAATVHETRQLAWRDRTNAAKSAKLALLEKNRNIIANIQQQVERCHEMLSSARSSEHQQRVQGWIDEKLDKMTDIERFNRELEDQIRDIDTKLNK